MRPSTSRAASRRDSSWLTAKAPSSCRKISWIPSPSEAGDFTGSAKTVPPLAAPPFDRCDLGRSDPTAAGELGGGGASSTDALSNFSPKFSISSPACASNLPTLVARKIAAACGLFRILSTRLRRSRSASSDSDPAGAVCPPPFLLDCPSLGATREAVAFERAARASAVDEVERVAPSPVCMRRNRALLWRALGPPS
jgi:hypothetical protein